ncbi:MAG TPA: carboxypeptidase-like regulatory domain-containing protein, partial [Thermoanaerobaculia bacterium]|nr:carboxypeptidase-like regulatory domain-containing protein [Thermoanaerobaculia bacterium]
PRWAARAERPDRTRTAPDGHFHFLDLPAGDYTLAVSLPREGSRYGTTTTDVTLAADSQGEAILHTADLTLTPTTVRGKVLDPDGKAVPLADLRLRGSADRTYSNGKGEYTLSRLEAGSRELVVAAPGFQTQTKTVVLAQAGDVVDLDITLQPSTP